MKKIHVIGHATPSGSFALQGVTTSNGTPASENTLNTVYQVLRAIFTDVRVLIWDEGNWDEKQWV